MMNQVGIFIAQQMKGKIEGIRYLGGNWNFSSWVAGTIEARFRKPKDFYEQIGHRSFVIVPHEMSDKISFDRKYI